jgi:hypothetical protein
MSNSNSPRPDIHSRTIIDTLLKDARRQIVERGQVIPAAMIVHQAGMEVVVLDLRTPADRDRYAFMIRELASVYEANTVVMITEGWTLPAFISPDRAAELMAKYGAVSRMPERIEIVHILVETRAGGCWDGDAQIVRNGRSIRLAEPTYRDLSNPEYESFGRFAGFFAPERQVPESLRPGAR